MVALVCILEKAIIIKADTILSVPLFVKINYWNNYLICACLFFGIKNDYLKLQHI